MGIGMAVFFFALFIRCRQTTQLFCSILWLAPISYEAWVIYSCTGECNIRVDLAIIVPMEILMLLYFSIISWRRYREYIKSHATNE